MYSVYVAGKLPGTKEIPIYNETNFDQIDLVDIGEKYVRLPSQYFPFYEGGPGIFVLRRFVERGYLCTSIGYYVYFGQLDTRPGAYLGACAIFFGYNFSEGLPTILKAIVKECSNSIEKNSRVLNKKSAPQITHDIISKASELLNDVINSNYKLNSSPVNSQQYGWIGNNGDLITPAHQGTAVAIKFSGNASNIQYGDFMNKNVSNIQYTDFINKYNYVAVCLASNDSIIKFPINTSLPCYEFDNDLIPVDTHNIKDTILSKNAETDNKLRQQDNYNNEYINIPTDDPKERRLEPDYDDFLIKDIIKKYKDVDEKLLFVMNNIEIIRNNHGKTRDINIKISFDEKLFKLLYIISVIFITTLFSLGGVYFAVNYRNDRAKTQNNSSIALEAKDIKDNISKIEAMLMEISKEVKKGAAK